MPTYSILASSFATHPDVLQFYQLQKYIECAVCEDIFVCHYPGDAEKYTRMAHSSDFLVVFGDDLFFKDVVLVCNKPILYVPDNQLLDIYSRDYDMQTYISSAFEKGPRSLNIYKINHKPFLSSFVVGGIGNFFFDTNSVLLNLLKNNTNLHVSFTLDGYYFQRDCFSFVISNTSYVNGILMDKNNMNEEKLNVMIIKNKGIHVMLDELKDVLKKEREFRDLSFVETYSAKEIDFSFQEDISKFTYLDGEKLESFDQDIFIEPWKKVSLLDGKMERTLKK